MSAQLDVLTAGYAAIPRVASTVVLIRDGDAVIVVDPGMVEDRSRILGPLADLGVDPADVTRRGVQPSPSRPHRSTRRCSRRSGSTTSGPISTSATRGPAGPADGSKLAPSVTLMTTPGHTAQDITTLAATDRGLIACTHVWWTADGPDVDPLGENQTELERSRPSCWNAGPP